MRCTTTWLLAAAWAVVGCSSASGPQTPPALLNVFWISGGQRTQVWTNSQPDGGPAVTAPPAVQQVDFVFDQRLNGSKIQDAPTPPIRASWPELTADTGFAATVLYNSEPFYGGASSYALLRPAAVGVPSADAITWRWTAPSDQRKWPAVHRATEITVTTGPLDGDGERPVRRGRWRILPRQLHDAGRVFESRRRGPVSPFIHAATPAGALPVTVVANASDPTIVYVTAACAGGWPAGVPVTLTVDSGAPDAFGRLLAAHATGTFTAAAGAADGGCAL